MDRIYKKRILMTLLILICLISINSLIKPDMYQADHYGIEENKKEILFSNIKNHSKINDRILVTGSFEIVGPAKKWLDSE